MLSELDLLRQKTVSSLTRDLLDSLLAPNWIRTDSLLAHAKQFHDFLRDRIEQGGFTTEDVLASFLPLVRQVIETHESGHCAPLEGLGALQVEGVRIWFEVSHRCQPRKNKSGPTV